MKETIAAIATPTGKGGIAIIRISGPEAHTCLKKIFFKETTEMRKMYYGGIYDGDVLLDQCLCVLFEEGASYTGEKTAEIHCHGGYAAARDILDAVLKHGARLAQNGEFTKRAFLNGKLDLSQAEAVGDMIEADTQSASRAAAKLLSGELGKQISGFQETLKELLAEVEAGIDYPDEIDEQHTAATIHARIRKMLPQIDLLLSSYSRGKLVKDGLAVCIIGKPNAGKSSLLNALCGWERAIVTPIAGTTRDTLHEVLEISGVKVHLFDTAGIRQSEDAIEKVGIERSYITAKESDVILCIIDAAEKEDLSWLKEQEFLKKKQGIFLFNKSDIAAAPPLALPFPWPQIEISVKTGQGMEKVVQFLEQCTSESESASALTITSLRHFEALKAAKKALTSCLEDMPPDILSIDLTEAWMQLGRITGQNVTEDIIEHIFEKFCVGK